MFKKRLGEKLGIGAEKEVFINQENPEHAIGVFHENQKETPYKAKGRFYLTKILHLLLPKQIPDMHLASSDPHMIEVDRVQVDESVLYNKLLRDKKILFDKTENFGVFIDDYPKNFKYDQKDNLVYVDSVEPWVINSRYTKNKRCYDSEKIKTALEKLGGDKKEQGLDFLKRLEELYKEEIASIPKISQETRDEETKRIERDKKITLEIKNSWRTKKD